MLKKSDFISGFLLCAISAASFISTFVGRWSTGAGRGGATIFPRLSSAVIFATGLSILICSFRKEKSNLKFPEAGLLTTIVFFGLGVVCMLLSLNVGVVIGNIIYLTTAFLLLSASPFKDSKAIGLIAVLSSIGFWVLFVFFARMLLPQPLLF